MAKILPRFGYAGADAGAHFYLAGQEFGRDLVPQRLRAGVHQRIGHIGQGAGLGIDQQVFLFNAKRVIGCIHVAHAAAKPGSAQENDLVAPRAAR